jgi:PTS system fructose-specific IIA component
MCMIIDRIHQNINITQHNEKNRISFCSIERRRIPILYANEQLIQLDIQAEMREEIIDRLAELMEEKGFMSGNENFLHQVFEKEQHGTTVVAPSIAIPFGASEEVKEPTVAVARLRRPIYWDQRQPVSYVFLVAAPDQEKAESLTEQLKSKLTQPEMRQKLDHAQSPKQVLSLLH